MMNFSISVATLVLFSVLPLAGCSRAGDETGDDGEDDGAIVASGGFRSPFAPGIYDSEHGSMRIVAWRDGQTINSSIDTPELPLNLCGGELGLTDGAPSFESSACKLALKESTVKDTITVDGVLRHATSTSPYGATFKRRYDNALVGTYGHDGRRLTIDASDENTITFSMKMGDSVIANRVVAVARRPGPSGPRVDDFGYYLGKIAACELKLLVVRVRKQFVIGVARNGAAADDSKCPSTALLYPLTSPGGRD